MLYTFTIKNKSGQPIPGATVLFITDTGQRVTSMTAGNTGIVEVDSGMDSGLFEPGINIDFSAPGYWNYGVSTASLPQNFSVVLEKRTNTAVLLGIGAAAGALMFIASPKKVKGFIGAAESGSRKAGLPSWVLPVGIIWAGAAVLVSFLNKPDPKANDSATIISAADRELTNLGHSGVTPTISPATAESLSAVIVEETDDCGTNEESIYDAFAQLGNIADLWLLIKTFAVREIHSCFGGNYLGNTPYNLPQIITAELSNGERATLNNILQQKGINYTF